MNILTEKNWLILESNLKDSELMIKGFANNLEEITLEQFKELLKQ